MAFFQRLIPERVLPLPLSSPEDNVINKVVEISVDRIVPNPAQPRVIFNDYELSQLAISIQQNGILQPLTVRAVEGSGYAASYELISGERRLRASKLAGLAKVPCIVMEATSKDSAVLAIMENIQRSDLNYIEEAFAISRLIEYLQITQEEAAVKLGIAQSTVANKLRLLKLSDEEKAMALRYGLNERQARALLKISGELRVQAIERISSAQLNTAATDRLIAEMVEEQKKPSVRKAPARKSFFVRQATLYINTFNHTIDSMKKAGIDCVVKKNKTDEFMEYSVRIPLK
jgi:ParB family chromosome partitioning protein